MTHADLKEAAEKATPGEWSVGSQNDALYITVGKPPAPDNDSPVHDADRRALGKIYTADDAAFIALANPSSILSLIEENERMREALTPFAEFNTKIDAHPDAAKTPDDYCIHDGLKVGDFRRAFSVIKDKP